MEDVADFRFLNLALIHHEAYQREKISHFVGHVNLLGVVLAEQNSDHDQVNADILGSRTARKQLYNFFDVFVTQLQVGHQVPFADLVLVTLLRELF